MDKIRWGLMSTAGSIIRLFLLFAIHRAANWLPWQAAGR